MRQKLWMGLAILGVLVVVSEIRLNAARVVIPAGSMESALVYPNPWRGDRHANRTIRFEKVPENSRIKLFTVSGHEIKALTAGTDGIATWDRTNSSGQQVASGVYLYLVTDHQGRETLGKIAIIR